MTDSDSNKPKIDADQLRARVAAYLSPVIKVQREYEAKLLSCFNGGIKPGDKVYHRPSKETWRVAAVCGGELSPMGWPESIVYVADCDLLESCPDSASMEVIEKWGRMGKPDWRCWKNFDILEERDAVQCSEVMRI